MFTASDQIDFSDQQAVRALFEAQVRELALRDPRLAEKDALIESRHAAIAARDEKLSSRDQQIEHLTLLLEKMRHNAYGAKSEKHERNVDQLELKLEELVSGQAADDVVEPPTPDKPIKNKPARKPLPDHLRREVKHFRGVLQADAYAGFGHLDTAGSIQEAACMAHTSGSCTTSTRFIRRGSQPKRSTGSGHPTESSVR